MASLTSTFVPSSLAFKSNISSVQGLRSTVQRAQPLCPQRVPVIESKVAIRFTRLGRKKLPFYRIVAVDSKKRRDGAPLEYLGWYDPIQKQANLNAPAIKKWISVGAQPTDTVHDLLKKAMIIE